MAIYPSTSSTAALEWYYWNDTTSTATTTATIWCRWVSTTTTTATTTGRIWREWQEFGAPLPQDDAIARAEADRRAEEYRRQFEREREARAAAEKRAEELLVENLSLKQRERYKRDGWFIVHGKGCRYRIRRGRIANVDVIARDGEVLRSLCAHPGESVPDPDTMLAQKLMLETAEEEFLRVANVHARRCSEAHLPMLH